MGKAENFSTSLQLDISQVRAVILRAKNKAIVDQVIWYFELTKFQPSYICSKLSETIGKTSQY